MEQLQHDHLAFLENLVRQDRNNLGSARYALQLRFKLTKEEASNIVLVWLKSIQPYGKVRP